VSLGVTFHGYPDSGPVASSFPTYMHFIFWNNEWFLAESAGRTAGQQAVSSASADGDGCPAQS